MSTLRETLRKKFLANEFNSDHLRTFDAVDDALLEEHWQFIQQVEQQKCMDKHEQVANFMFDKCSCCEKMIWSGVILVRGVIEHFPCYRTFTSGPYAYIKTLCIDCKDGCYCEDNPVLIDEAAAECKVCGNGFCKWHQQNACRMCPSCFQTWTWGIRLRETLQMNGVPDTWEEFRLVLRELLDQ